MKEQKILYRKEQKNLYNDMKEQKNCIMCKTKLHRNKPQTGSNFNVIADVSTTMKNTAETVIRRCSRKYCSS